MDAPAVPARRKRLPRAAREEQLIGIAEELFGQQGIQATSMDEIAERAGVSKPVIYDHFGSKDGMVLAVIERARAELLQRTMAANEGAATAKESLHASLLAFFRFIEEHGPAWAVLLDEHSVSGEHAAALEEIRRSQVEFMVDALAAWLGPRTPDVYEVHAQAVIGACERLALWRRGRPEVTDEVVTDMLVDLLWLGMHPRGPVGTGQG